MLPTHVSDDSNTGCVLLSTSLKKVMACTVETYGACTGAMRHKRP